MGSARKTRVGAVNYLNTKPLVYQLEQLAPWIDLVYDFPSRLADDLAAGRLDVALIPSIELFQNRDYRIVSDACIGCRGPVLSVKLFSRVPVGKIRTLALDEGSRTSVALVRLLLKEQHGIEPCLQPLPIGASVDETDVDAVLLIGDRAMHSPLASFCAVWDLGDQWCRWTRLPFVFALWTARRGEPMDELEPALAEARNLGVANIEEIAHGEAARLGLTEPQCIDYLRDNLNFCFGTREQQGLKLFYDYAAELGLAPSGFPIFAEPYQTAGQTGPLPPNHIESSS